MAMKSCRSMKLAPVSVAMLLGEVEELVVLRRALRVQVDVVLGHRQDHDGGVDVPVGEAGQQVLGGLGLLAPEVEVVEQLGLVEPGGGGRTARTAAPGGTGPGPAGR